MKKSVLVLLFFIILLAAGLRLYALTRYPGGFNADEAAIGYNAYSLLKTGHDEHGAAWPLVFKSFGDYKAPLYFYIVLPFVASMGLTELAVRLPSALFGVATVVLIYFLAKKIFANEWIGLLAAFFLAISPWHLHFSRGGWEVNVATFFITLGVYAFLKGLGNSKWFYASFISFIASVYTYQSPKIIVPLLGIGLLTLFYKKLWSLKRSLLLPIVIAVIIGAPLLLTFFSKSGYARFTGVSIFSDTGPFWGINEARGEHNNPDGMTAKVYHNKVIGYGLDFLKNYSDHYTPSFLFFNGDIIDRNNIPEMGVMYVVDALFLLLGIYFVLKKDIEHKGVVLLWLVVAPSASAITFQTPHALRSANMVIPLTLLVATGVYYSFQAVKSKGRVLMGVCVVVVALLYTYHFAKYVHEYYVHIPEHLPLANNYGFNELAPYLESQKDQFSKIVVTDRYDQPYILFLFYSKKDPESIQKQIKLTPRDKFGFSTVTSYDNYEFRAINKEDLLQKNALVVGDNDEIPDNDPRIVKTIYFQNGKPAFKIIKT